MYPDTDFLASRSIYQMLLTLSGNYLYAFEYGVILDSIGMSKITRLAE